MIRVYTASNLPDAHIVANLLARAGVEARVFNENAQSGLGDIPFGEAYPQVWVMDDKDADRARDLIRVHERTSANVGTVFCRACAEENPGNFETCWKCGQPLL